MENEEIRVGQVIKEKGVDCDLEVAELYVIKKIEDFKIITEIFSYSSYREKS